MEVYILKVSRNLSNFISFMLVACVCIVYGDLSVVYANRHNDWPAVNGWMHNAHVQPC